MSTVDVLAVVDAKKSRIDGHRPLPADSVKSLREDFAVRYAHNTTALEGNTLTLRETQVVIESGLVIAGKPLREHLEVVNVVDALRRAREGRERLPRCRGCRCRRPSR